MTFGSVGGSAAAASGSDWLKQDERKMLHAVYRVGDMDATIEYYKKHFGAKLLRYRDIPEAGTMHSMQSVLRMDR
jgi:lactoylglutathione lyase